ncbi:hypothetical protein BC832DRAFT_560269 [Gaertneriomyces semiglobifer]|nr:hypothetical protein BC832DRAFT_560269 [Gaertneriomyces semiglobifer]
MNNNTIYVKVGDSVCCLCVCVNIYIYIYRVGSNVCVCVQFRVGKGGMCRDKGETLLVGVLMFLACASCNGMQQAKVRAREGRIRIIA